MREIKFRAWDKDAKCMVEVNSIHLPLGKPSGKDITVYNQELECYEWIYNYELMQNTGLIDRNGKDIYEGDIVRHFKRDKNKLLKIEISPSYGVYAQESYSTKRIIGRSNTHLYYEVIGNIYENPELLEWR